MITLRRAHSIHELIGSVMSATLSHGVEDITVEVRAPVGASPLSAHFKPKRVLLTETYCNQVINDSADTLYSICELAHTKCARLLKLRADVNSKMAMTDFVEFFNVTQMFINDSEKLCGKQCYGLRPAPLAQVLIILHDLLTSPGQSLSGCNSQQQDLVTDINP